MPLPEPADGFPTFSKAAFDLEMRGGKVDAAEAVAKKPSGKEMFLRHLVVEEDDGPDEGEHRRRQLASVTRGADDLLANGAPGPILPCR